ncbi:DUF4176 domain-containing protein [Streptococcus uberis]|uniref:DUF4176 domain-containing protein n=1 Tax=Streptococcus uberis TaxID=1349 RepID=UPI00062026EA|nr:DUF4176 domain-containing protein [Streptococcus uberis]KKF52443.1 hypothetical protein AF67_04270 [Streptococcus uberis 6780]MCK1168073.1 DUF4176 domain-containing protein [Streptococcus uberis]MCK1193573.1 DUF4176 domain-containing protein [Streptococcus uberis]MCK1210160.1 DUF4176 domain-containing protein [Streptococcus uberis]MCK1216930.1 DUF4176 domain-containing protein [Streptococcus uberis]
MNKVHTLGSVIKLKNDNQKIMITSRFPLYNNEGQLGYFDYSGCIFPIGIVGNETYFFNLEDIDKVLFEGYYDENEEKMQNIFLKQINDIKYPHFSVDVLKQ